MKIIDIIPGVKIYLTENYSILFGCPPEIIKHLMIRNISMPDYIVIPDTLYKNGIVQNATEFPLYYNLFVLGNFFKGKKINILGNPSQISNNRQLLSLTLLGPTLEEYNVLGDSKYFNGLYNESRFLSLKNKDGSEVSIDGFVNFLSFSQDIIENQYFKLFHKSKNVYEIDGNFIDINFNEPQFPPYDLRPDFVPLKPMDFGVDILGGSSGFSATKPCSGIVINHDSEYMLVDCLPYLEYSLNARGISKHQVKSLFLTHIHDDHCNIFPLVEFDNKIKFLATKEIYWMACKKLSLMTEHPVESFYHYFDFIELKPYTENEFYGMSINPHYTVHSIPTIGAKFTMKCNGQKRSIVFVGDNKALPSIKEMSEQGVVYREKYEYLQKLYHEHYDLLFSDGGMGILHGDPRDSIHSKSSRVIFLHLENLPKEYDTTFTLASHGKRYVISEADDKSYYIKTLLILNDRYSGIAEEWQTTLLSNMNIVTYNTGDIIMKQGDLSNKYIYIILSGAVSILYHDGQELKELAVKNSGDIIGDMAAINRVEKRSASVVAKIPVTLSEIDEELFYSFVKSEQRIDEIQRKWNIHSELERCYPFSNFSEIVNEKIVRNAQRLFINQDHSIIEQGSIGNDFYIILSGCFQIIQDGKVVNILKSGDMFGEYGSLSHQIRNATVKALEDSVLLKLKSEDIIEIVNTTPALGFYINQLMKDRNEEFSQ